VKFEYLSYCLKVKELDDEEITYCSADEPLYRIETGNYEYRYNNITKIYKYECTQTSEYYIVHYSHLYLVYFR